MIAARESHKSRAIAYLSDGEARTPAEIARHLGIDIQFCAPLLCMLMRRSLIIRVGGVRSRWMINTIAPRAPGVTVHLR